MPRELAGGEHAKVDKTMVMSRLSSPQGRVPKPSLRNPFKPGSALARQFDGMLKAYADGHRDVVREGGTTRCMGNSMATAFWRGYDSTPPHTIPRNTLSWACYRAGQAQRIVDHKRGVYLPPKTNSGVPLA